MTMAFSCIIKNLRQISERKRVVILLLCLSGISDAFLSPSAYANNNNSNTIIGRYLDVSNQPSAHQQDLLNQTFQMRFPPFVKTVGNAMNYLLQMSGYSLVSTNLLIPSVKQLMLLPLPESHCMLGPLTVKEGLLTLAGKPFGLLVDPVHRLISFRLLAPYATLYQTSSPNLTFKDFSQN